MFLIDIIWNRNIHIKINNLTITHKERLVVSGLLCNGVLDLNDYIAVRRLEGSSIRAHKHAIEAATLIKRKVINLTKYLSLRNGYLASLNHNNAIKTLQANSSKK